MSHFTLHLLAVDRSERIEGVRSFVGEDSSGSFGVLAHHERLITVLSFSLARMLRSDGVWEYLGFPGGLLYFVDNECRISTRRYLRDTDVARLAQSLGHELLAEEQGLKDMRAKLQRLEAEMFKRWAGLEKD